MHVRKISLIFALAVTISLGTRPSSTNAQNTSAYHQIEGRVQVRGRQVRNIHVRLTLNGRTITETFTNPEGHFTFKSLTEGDYLVETVETDEYEPTSTTASVFPRDRENPAPTIVIVMVELSLKSAKRNRPGVITADVDINVPKEAQKRYLSGMKALESGDNDRAVSELEAAIAVYPKYYAARLELGRELRLQKRFAEAEKVLEPLGKIAPSRAEPRIEHGIVLLELQRREDAVSELRAALELEETNWATHLYLGWALLETDKNTAEGHFKRALELDEQRAARAHIALGRIADEKGQRQLALAHLDAYLALAPTAPDAEAVRKLANRLRNNTESSHP